jgi:site-specific DNA-methyltransferase (adenine-specific)
MTYQILHGNNLDILPTLADNSIDSIVTDPPYELGFMGKKWDSSGIAYSVELWQQCLRVLKPGGHLLSFGGTRTYHRVAVAIEDAGFELRDSIAWLYGSGFPKSLDVSKAIDKAAGAERDEWPTLPMQEKGEVGEISKNRRCGICLKALASGNPCQCDRASSAITPEAQQWQGWGTALKPAFEPVIVARKPIEGTVANNVLKWGTGGLNIDGSRIGTETISTHNAPKGSFAGGEPDRGSNTSSYKEHTGRWPANIILDPYTAELLDEQSGQSKGSGPGTHCSKRDELGNCVGHDNAGRSTNGQTFHSKNSQNQPDSGGASRFFYVAKASKRDRNEGLDELPDTHPGEITGRKAGSAGAQNGGYAGMTETPRKNIHPTVKPTSLMEYLIKLVTPPQGTVLDPFTGSGSTGKAAILQGFDFIGIEMTEEYLPIIEGRLKHAEHIVAERIKETSDKQSEVLF